MFSLLVEVPPLVDFVLPFLSSLCFVTLVLQLLLQMLVPYV